MKKRLVKLTILSLMISGLMVQPLVVSASDDNVSVLLEDDATDDQEGSDTDGEDVSDEPGIEESEETPIVGEWVKSGSRWWYRFSDNTYPAGEIMEIENKKYAFDAEGWMVTGWYKEGDIWYYFGGSGAMQTGWIKYNGTWYYLNPSDGKMAADTMEVVKGQTYMFNATGAMLTGWQKKDGIWYYFDGSGAMIKGWSKYNGTWYYLNPSDGKMLADTLEVINGKTYMFNTTGAMLTGWQKKANEWYYFESSGAMKTGWILYRSKWYYLDPSTGVMSADTLQTIEEKTYCFTTNGDMVVGPYAKKVNVSDSDTGAVHTVTRNYYFETSGAMKTGWVKINGKWSYYDLSNGIRYEGDIYSIKGDNYAFDDNGIMVTGWYTRTKAVTDSETGKTYYVKDRYYFGEDGSPKTGWVTEGNDNYWINKDGWAVANGEYPVDKDRTGLFDENGKFVKFV